jgi:hypothetical protein
MAARGASSGESRTGIARRAVRAAFSDLGLTATVAAWLSVAALFVAWLQPSILPPSTGMGVVVGLGAWITGMAVSAARTRRTSRRQARSTKSQRASTRKVRTTSGARRCGTHDATILRGTRVTAASQLASWLPATSGARLRIGVVPADIHTAASEWALELAEAMAAEGRRVLYVDLVERCEEGRPGVTEVARGWVPLSTAVESHERLSVARLGPGADRRSAAAELSGVLANLPDAIDAVVVALPHVGSETIPVAGDALGHLAFVAVRATTRKSTLRRALAAAGEGTQTSVALVDPVFADESPARWRSRIIVRTDPKTEPLPDDPRIPPVHDGPLTVEDVWGRELALEDSRDEQGNGLSQRPLRPADVWTHDDEHAPATAGSTGNGQARGGNGRRRLLVPSTAFSGSVANRHP